MKEVVDYRVLSPGDLANSVMTEGGWSDFLVFPSLLPSSFIPHSNLLDACKETIN